MFVAGGHRRWRPEPDPRPRPGVKKEKLKVEIEVPFVPTNEKVVAAMLKLAAVKEGDTVYDLGCGDGRIVIAAVKDFKAKKGLGVDFNPERLKDCEKPDERPRSSPRRRRRRSPSSRATC